MSKGCNKWTQNSLPTVNRLASIQIRGFVPDTFKGKGFNLRIEDTAEIEAFYSNEQIDTGLQLRRLSVDFGAR